MYIMYIKYIIHCIIATEQEQEHSPHFRIVSSSARRHFLFKERADNYYNYAADNDDSKADEATKVTRCGQYVHNNALLMHQTTG